MRAFATGVLAAVLSAASGCTTPAGDLQSAAASCDLPGVKAALAAKADPNARSGSGSTPLMMASWNGCGEVVQTLIAAGADVNAKLDDASFPWMKGKTALMDAAAQHSEIVDTLLAAGADPNARQADGQTALTNAARYGQLEAARALVAAGADVNVREDSGETPLAEATFNGKSMATGNFGTLQAHAAIAELLRQHGGYADSPWDREGAEAARP